VRQHAENRRECAFESRPGQLYLSLARSVASSRPVLDPFRGPRWAWADPASGAGFRIRTDEIAACDPISDNVAPAREGPRARPRSTAPRSARGSR
jgi:hypothetical protein